MPIRPENKSRYPGDWGAIRERILARAGHCCEGTWQHPQCRVPNYSIHPETGSKVVLTIAHYHDPDPANCDPANLRALCNRCHLNLDRPYHVRMRRLNRAKALEQVQPRLSLEGDE